MPTIESLKVNDNMVLGIGQQIYVNAKVGKLDVKVLVYILDIRQRWARNDLLLSQDPLGRTGTAWVEITSNLIP